jgi:chromosome segregation ATPase
MGEFMETTDLTTVILRSIRADIAALDTKLNAKIDTELRAVREELDKRVTREEFRDAIAGLGGRMSELSERVDRTHTRLVENDVRAINAHHELQLTLSRLTDFLDAHGDLTPRVDRCEQDIGDLKQRVL